MSTIFAIKVRGEFIPVAHRSNGIRWTNDIAATLSWQRRVYPMDNTAQGIYCIGDIRRIIEETENGK